MANNKRMVDLMNIIINDTEYAEECHGIWSEIDNEWRLLKFVANRIKSKCEGRISIETLAALPIFDIGKMLPDLEQVKYAKEKYCERKQIEGWHTNLKGVGIHFQDGVNWTLNYITKRK